jgi:hypothetical protein
MVIKVEGITWETGDEMREMRYAEDILVGYSEEKIKFGRPRRKWTTK